MVSYQHVHNCHMVNNIAYKQCAINKALQQEQKTGYCSRRQGKKSNKKETKGWHFRPQRVRQEGMTNINRDWTVMAWNFQTRVVLLGPATSNLRVYKLQPTVYKLNHFTDFKPYTKEL